MKEESKIKSMDFIKAVSNPEISENEVKAKWYDLPYKFRLRKWQKELKHLTEESGLTLAGVADYIGATVKKTLPGFYTRLPKKKETYVKIGLALQQPREVVDQWIKKNTKHRVLYAKDPKDLVAIYFLNLSSKDKRHVKNYCDIYVHYLEKVTKEVEDIQKVLKEAGKYKGEMGVGFKTSIGTIELEKGIDKEEDLINYMKVNYSSFQDAYKKSRDYLLAYIDILLESLNRAKVSLVLLNRTERDHDAKWSKRTLWERGNISDANYNYLTGNEIKGKQIPQTKSSYISIALNLGMGKSQINEFLEMAGFDAININDEEQGFCEFTLNYLLPKWDMSHQEAVKWRKKYIDKEVIDMSTAEEAEALKQILNMKNDIAEIYMKEFKDKGGFTF